MTDMSEQKLKAEAHHMKSLTGCEWFRSRWKLFIDTARGGRWDIPLAGEEAGGGTVVDSDTWFDAFGILSVYLSSRSRTAMYSLSRSWLLACLDFQMFAPAAQRLVGPIAYRLRNVVLSIRFNCWMLMRISW